MYLFLIKRSENERVRTEYIIDEAMEQVLGILTPSNRMVMKVILQTGLRVSDVLRLRPDQIARQFWITEKKTGKRRRVNLTDQIMEELREISGKNWIFEGRDPEKHKTRQAVWHDVKRAAKAYRLPNNVGTHSGRKIFAVKLMEKYGDIEKVQKALNHESASVTILYACADSLVSEKKKRHRYRK